MSLQLGYCCINTTLQADGVNVNRKIMLKTYRKDPDRAIELAESNLKNVLKILKWNEENCLRNYRLSSDMFPQITNPACIEDGKYAYELENFESLLKKIGKYAYKHGHRLTMHPGHYNQVGTPRKSVLDKTIIDLTFHADLMDMMGIDNNGVMVVHGGGVYGDKKASIKRWKSQFWELPGEVQNRLVIENDEKSYGIDDIVKLQKGVEVPIVLDFHHYNCYQEVESQTPLPDILPVVLKSWGDRKPKFHLSEQAKGLKTGAHSDYVKRLPKIVKELAKTKHIDVMIEAKAKELSVQYLYDKYFTYDKESDKYVLEL